MFTLPYLKQLVGSARVVNNVSHESKQDVAEYQNIYCNTGDGLLIEVETNGILRVYTSTDRNSWTLVESIVVNGRTIRQYDYAVNGSYWKVEGENLISHLSFRAIKPFMVSPLDITDLDKQVIESDAGYDGIVELINVRPDPDLSVVILEQPESFTYEINPGGVQHLSQTIWCMAMTSAEEDRKKVQRAMKVLMRRIISKMIKAKHSEELRYWDRSRIPVLLTNTAGNYTGYQFTLYFDEPTDLSISQFDEAWP